MTNTTIEKLRGIAVGPVGYAWVRKRELVAALPAYSVAGNADAFLRDAILCQIVGMESECLELLAKSEEWMTNALRRAESGEMVHVEHDCHFTLAQCRWLAGAPAGQTDLSRALVSLDRYADTATPQNYADVFAWVLPRWLDAGRAEECVEAFERFEPRYPPARRRHHTPVAMVYLLARQRLRDTLSPTELDRLHDDFLTRQVPDMLGRGGYSDFARWVKLITDAEPGPAARDAVRRTAEKYA